MHLLTQQSVDIKQPVPVVFNYVTNMENFSEWFPGVLSIESSNEVIHGQAGKEYLETVSIPLRGMRKIRLVVREANANKFFATEGKLPPLMPRMEIAFSEAGADAGTCNLTWRMYSRNKGSLAKFFLVPLARRVMTKRAEIGLIRLKQKLENA